MHNLNIIVFALYEIIVVLTIIHVVMDNRQPAKTMAWGLVILATGIHVHVIDHHVVAATQRDIV